MSTTETHLYLVGDDEALDTLAELTRHLPLFELARVDAITAPLVAGAIVVIGATHPRLRDARVAEALQHGADQIVLVPEAPAGAHPGARAIVAASELVKLLVPGLSTTQPA